VPGVFKGVEKGEIKRGVILSEVQITIFNFYLYLKQKELSAHMECTLNHEKSVKSEPNSVKIRPTWRSLDPFLSILDMME
jgi:hypothetical protein